MTMQHIIRVGDIGRWTFLSNGQKLGFGSHKSRTIRVDIRASADAFWAVERVTGDGEIVQEFLCVTPPGLSTIEVAIDKTGLTLIPDFADGEHVAFSAAEYEPFDLEAAHPGESFLKIAHRRQRNPEVEYMEFLMNQNMEARLRTMDEEIARRLAALPSNERNEDGNRVHEQSAPQREKLPADAKAKTGKGGVGVAAPDGGKGQQLLSPEPGSGSDDEPNGGSGE